MVEFTKKPTTVGPTLYLHLDKDIRELHNIDEKCLVTFEIKRVQKIELTEEVKEKKDDSYADTRTERFME